MSHLFFSTLPSTNTNTQSTRTHTHTYTHTHMPSHTLKRQSNLMFSEWGRKKKREKKIRKKTSSCVSAGGVGVVALCCCPSPSCMPTPLAALTAHSTCCDMKFTRHTHTHSRTYTVSKREPFAFVVHGKDSRKLSLASVNAYTVPHPLLPSPYPSNNLFPLLPCVFLSHRMIKISVRGLDKYFIKRPHNRY